MIPESLQIALERTGLPVKPRYTGQELVDLLAATSDLSESADKLRDSPYLLTQKQVGRCFGMSRAQVHEVERNIKSRMRREAGLDDLL